MRAKDLMKTPVMSVRDSDKVEDLLDVLVGERIHGAPVLDGDQALVGVVTQQDVFFASVTRSPGKPSKAKKKKVEPLRVRDIMTSPPVSADEDIDIRDLCRIMSKLRIHRIPITREGRLAGIVSSLDVCAAVSDAAEF